jgi:glutaredoxin
MEKVKVYGADWCGLTRRTLTHLDTLGVEYQYIDVDKDPEASQWVKDQNNGKEKKPTLQIGDQTLTAPSNRQLDETLREENVLIRT